VKEGVEEGVLLLLLPLLLVVVLVAVYPNGLSLGCSCCDANGRRKWWVVSTECYIIWWGLNSECGSMHNLVCANLITVLLTVLSEGSWRWGGAYPGLGPIPISTL